MRPTLNKLARKYGIKLPVTTTTKRAAADLIRGLDALKNRVARNAKDLREIMRNNTRDINASTKAGSDARLKATGENAKRGLRELKRLHKLGLVTDAQFNRESAQLRKQYLRGTGRDVKDAAAEMTQAIKAQHGPTEKATRGILKILGSLPKSARKHAFDLMTDSVKELEKGNPKLKGLCSRRSATQSSMSSVRWLRRRLRRPRAF